MLKKIKFKKPSDNYSRRKRSSLAIGRGLSTEKSQLLKRYAIVRI